MPQILEKIALGGGCHWCTEAIFQSLIGVQKVEQGYVSSTGENSDYSEAVIVHFNSKVISLDVLIEIHLYTHNSTSAHSMRKKYRSAVYTFSSNQMQDAVEIIERFQRDFNFNVITKVYNFSDFTSSRAELLDYYKQDPQKPFCTNYITPKLKIVLDRFSKNVDPNF